MLSVDGVVHLSASDLVGHLNCHYLTKLDLAVAKGKLDKPSVWDPVLEVLVERGALIMKGYMESGEFSRGKESIRADGSIVMVGNFEVDVQHQQRVGHLFGALPPEMRDDTAFMDRIHTYLPGWDLPKVSRDLLTDHFGLVSDFLSECWDQLRRQSRQSLLQGRVHLGGALSGRDATGVQKTISGLIKLVSPNPDAPVSDEVLEWALRIAMECRRRVKEQQKRIGSAEFRNTQFSYSMGDDGVEKFVPNAGAIQREQYWQRSPTTRAGLGHFVGRPR
jgi:ATP-dependent Lon protease